MRPRLLDLFCGAGGAAMGYHRAGFDVVGVDHKPQPHYPFEFVRADALIWVSMSRVAVEFDAIHASPPCQDYSRAMRHLAAPQPRLIEPVREQFAAIGLPWVIENVPGAPLPYQDTLDGRHGIQLCGTSFGLRVHRHRLFESNIPLTGPSCGLHGLAMNPHNQRGRDRIHAEFGRQNPDPIWNQEMGVPWMDRYEGREAIPPAYTELIGHQLIDHLRHKENAA